MTRGTLGRHWQRHEYMTGCHSLRPRVSADSSVDEAAMQALFRTPPQITAWGDMSVQVPFLKSPLLRGFEQYIYSGSGPDFQELVQAVLGSSGTALLRATAYARRTPGRLPTDDGLTEVEGSYQVLRASVARANLRPTMRVQNVSVAVTFQSFRSAADTSSQEAKSPQEFLKSSVCNGFTKYT